MRPHIPNRKSQYLELHKSQAEALITSYCKPVMRSSSRRKGSEVGPVRHAIPRIVLDPLSVRRLMEPPDLAAPGQLPPVANVVRGPERLDYPPGQRCVGASILRSTTWRSVRFPHTDTLPTPPLQTR